MSDQTTRPLTPGQREILESIPELPGPVVSIAARMALGAAIRTLESIYDGHVLGKSALAEGSTAKTMLKQAIDELNRLTTPPF